MTPGRVPSSKIRWTPDRVPPQGTTVVPPPGLQPVILQPPKDQLQRHLSMTTWLTTHLINYNIFNQLQYRYNAYIDYIHDYEVTTKIEL